MSQKKSSYKIKEPLEAYTRTLIEKRLESLGYNMDERDEECNIYRERAKYQYQEDLLNGRRPDFLVYKHGTSKILAVIEAKRPSQPLVLAINQAIEYYAKPLNIPIIFVYNAGAFAGMTKNKKPVKIDNIDILDFVDEDTLLQLIEGNGEIESVPSGFTLTKPELLRIFKSANNLLRKAGLREGYERFSVFSDLMFLKLKADFSDIGEDLAQNKEIDNACSWKKLVSKIPPRNIQGQFEIEGSEAKSYLEDTIKTKLRVAYGDVFETSLNIKEETILLELIEEIDAIRFNEVESDVKGDAFEFFLRNVTNGNKDLGEYYTPRHIVKMIVTLINPIFGEKIYDPCCGTGGFLLEIFKHLKEKTDIVISKSDAKETIIEKENRRKIIRENSIYGREITSTARIAKMNMILFGDGHSNIEQMDCLSQVKKEEFDVVISNIPYSQKVEHGALYDFPTTNGDSLFMQHIWKSVKKGGRIAVVVPDTFLYGKETFNIRKKIVDESSNIIVISLPRGVFNPYTPTKTSILVAWKRRNEKECLDLVTMYVVRNDGFELGARRRPLEGISDCNKFLMEYNVDKNLRVLSAPTSIDVPREKITFGTYNLFPFEYMEHLPKGINYDDMWQIGDFIRERKEMFDKDKFSNEDFECVVLSVTKNGIYIGETYTASEMSALNQDYKKVYSGDFTYNPHRINIGSIGIVPNLSEHMYVSKVYPVFYITDELRLPSYYLLKTLKSSEYKEIINDYCLGGARADLKIEGLSKIKIAKPSEEEKRRISEQSDKLTKAYQKYLKIYKEIMS